MISKCKDRINNLNIQISKKKKSRRLHDSHLSIAKIIKMKRKKTIMMQNPVIIQRPVNAEFTFSCMAPVAERKRIGEDDI